MKKITFLLSSVCFISFMIISSASAQEVVKQKVTSRKSANKKVSNEKQQNKQVKEIRQVEPMRITEQEKIRSAEMHRSPDNNLNKAKEPENRSISNSGVTKKESRIVKAPKSKKISKSPPKYKLRTVESSKKVMNKQISPVKR